MIAMLYNAFWSVALTGEQGSGLMGWSLLPNALRPFKIYCASPSFTSQLVLFLWQTVEIGPLGHVRVVEASRMLEWILKK